MHRPIPRGLMVLAAALILPSGAAGAGPDAPSQRLRRLVGEYTTAFQAKQYDQALASAKAALQLAEEALGPQDAAVAQILNDIGVLHRLQQRHDEAIAAHERALAIRQGAGGADRSPVAQSLDNLIVSHLALKRDAKAAHYFEQLISIVEAHYPPGHPFWAELVDSYAACLRRLGREDEAAAHERRVQAYRKLNRGMEESLSGQPAAP